MFIYKITNNINGKIYIGKTTTSINQRFNRHVKSSQNDSNLYIHNAIRKYGETNFTIEEIDFTDNLKDLSTKEKYWIEYYKSYDKDIGYNLTKGGEGGALVGDALERMKQHRKGQKPSQETLQKRSQALKGKLSGEKNPMYGKKPANYGKSMDDFFGIEKSTEIKNKIRENTLKGMKNSIKYNNYLTNIIETYYSNPNYCKKCGCLIEYEPGYKHKTCKKCRLEK